MLSISFYLKIKFILNKKKKWATFGHLKTQSLCKLDQFLICWTHTSKPVTTEYFSLQLVPLDIILDVQFNNIFQVNQYFWQLSFVKSVTIPTRFAKAESIENWKKRFIFMVQTYYKTLTRRSQESKGGFAVLEFIIQLRIL